MLAQRALKTNVVKKCKDAAVKPQANKLNKGKYQKSLLIICVGSNTKQNNKRKRSQCSDNESEYIPSQVSDVETQIESVDYIPRSQNKRQKTHEEPAVQSKYKLPLP